MLELLYAKKARTNRMSHHVPYWDYLSPYQRDLIREGSFLYQEVFTRGTYTFQDYSFVVFPFAKAFEGFIKQFLLDLKLITHEQYNSDHIRIGRLLSPEPAYGFRDDSLYPNLTRLLGREATDMVWMTWKFCRNQVFHYYPHNCKALNLNEAKERVHLVLSTIHACHDILQRQSLKVNLNSASQNTLPNII
jgi:hypothetical protein